MQVFDNREEAGRQLGARLAAHPLVLQADRVVVLGVPRGGLPVGAEVARILGAEFDVVVVRKLRSPANPEIGFGAVGADGYVDIDAEIVERMGVAESEIDAEVSDRTAAVEQRLAVYREVAERVDLEGALVLVVDDGVATGGTARQACAFARRSGARSVVLATPVAPADIAERLGDVVDDIVLLSSPAEFMSVSQAYAEFSRLDDEAAAAAIRRGRESSPRGMQ